MMKKKMTDVSNRDCCRMALRRRQDCTLLTCTSNLSGDTAVSEDSGSMVCFRLGLLVHWSSSHRRHDSSAASFRKAKAVRPTAPRPCFDVFDVRCSMFGAQFLRAGCPLDLFQVDVSLEAMM